MSRMFFNTYICLSKRKVGIIHLDALSSEDVKMLSRLQERTLSYVRSVEKLIFHQILDDILGWKCLEMRLYMIISSLECEKNESSLRLMNYV